MPTGRITKGSVDALKKADRDQFLWDDELKGFGLRVTAKDARSYVYQYRMGGREARTRRFTIGGHGSPYTPASAREEAKRLAVLVGRGIDPASADKERRRQAVDLAFASYVDTFATGYLKVHWTRWEENKALLNREPVTVIGDTPLPLITRSQLSTVWDKLQDRPAVAKLAHATMRKLFRWAVERGDIDRSPMEGTKGPATVPARDRVLSDHEVALAWNAAADLGGVLCAFYRLLIATGQRRDEVAQLDWGEIDQDTAVWTLPGARAKNGEQHFVPLSPLAIATLSAVAGKEKWPKRGWVFSTNGKVPISGFSKAKSRLDTAMRALVIKVEGDDAPAIPAWRVHDIRRTVATGFQRLGVRFEVTEAVLNHISGSRSGIAGVYQRHDWKEEKRAALDAWSTKILSLAHD